MTIYNSEDLSEALQSSPTGSCLILKIGDQLHELILTVQHVKGPEGESVCLLTQENLDPNHYQLVDGKLVYVN